MKVPAILIPLPTAAGNHQYHNAKVLEDLGCAMIVEEKEFNEKPMVTLLNSMIQDPERLKNMSLKYPETQENADSIIAREVFQQLQNIYAWS